MGQWTFVKSNGAYKVRSREGLIMTNYAYRKNNNNGIYGYKEYNANANQARHQIWLPIRAKGGFILMNPDSSKCMSIYGTVRTGQVNIALNTCDKQSDRQIISLRGAKKLQFPENQYFNVCSKRGTCISAPLSNNQYILQQFESTYVKMMWKFVPTKGAYVVRNKDGLVLDNYAYRKNNGNPIRASKETQKRNQIWLPQMINKTQFILFNPDSAKCIKIQGAVKSGLNNFRLYDCNKEDENQIFTLETPKPYTLPTRQYFNIHFKAGTCLKSPVSINQRLKQGHCTTLRRVQWRFYPQYGGYRLQNKDAWVMTNYAYRKNVNNGIYAYKEYTASANQARSQIWLPIRAKGGFILMNPDSSKCMSIYGTVRTGQVNIALNYCNKED